MTPAPWLSMLIQLILSMGHVISEIKKMQARLSVTTVTRRGILQGIVSNLEKIGATQKLVLVSAISLPMTNNSGEAIVEQVL